MTYSAPVPLVHLGLVVCHVDLLSETEHGSSNIVPASPDHGGVSQHLLAAEVADLGLEPRRTHVPSFCLSSAMTGFKISRACRAFQSFSRFLPLSVTITRPA